MIKFERHIAIKNNDSTAISELTHHCELSTTTLKSAINKGALWLTRGTSTQRFRRLKKILKTNDTLHFYYDQAVLEQIPTAAQLIADKQDYSVWYKPYGMLSQGSKWSDHCTISRYAQSNLSSERSAFIVHRLDRAATGLILVAHSKKAVRLLSAMFEDHQLEKHYKIIVHGDHSKKPQPDIINVDIDGKKSTSTFTTLQYDQVNNVSLIKVKIDSGRKHQIRKHAASIGFPVVGDRLHGNHSLDEKFGSQANLQLCAVSLRFNCPLMNNEVLFEVPEELQPTIENLAKNKELNEQT